MNMIRHDVNLKHFVIIALKDAGYILVQLSLPLRLYQCGTVFYGKYKLEMQLGVSVGHGGIV